MADDGACGEIDDVFGDGLHEVADAFEFAADAVDVEPAAGHGGLFLDEFLGFVDETAVELVDGLVLLDDLACEVGVLVEHGAEEGVAHDGDALAEFDKAGGPLHGWLARDVEFAGHLGDAGGVVGGALDIGVDLEDEGEEAEVSGEGVLQGHEAEALLLDGDLFLVNGVVAFADFLGGDRVAPPEGLEGAFKHGDGDAGLVDEAALELDEAAVEGRARGGREGRGAAAGRGWLGHSTWSSFPARAASRLGGRGRGTNQVYGVSEVENVLGLWGGAEGVGVRRRGVP